MMDIKNIPGKLKTTCQFCVWKFEKRNGQKTKMPYNPATGERARINDLRTFADFKTTLVTYAMGGYDGIGIAVGNGIGAFDIDHCIREDGTLNDTADTVLSIFPTAYVEKSPSGKGLRGFFCVPEDYVYDKTVYYMGFKADESSVFGVRAGCVQEFAVGQKLIENSKENFQNQLIKSCLSSIL